MQVNSATSWWILMRFPNGDVVPGWSWRRLVLFLPQYETRWEFERELWTMFLLVSSNQGDILRQSCILFDSRHPRLLSLSGKTLVGALKPMSSTDHDKASRDWPIGDHICCENACPFRFVWHIFCHRFFSSATHSMSDSCSQSNRWVYHIGYRGYVGQVFCKIS